MPVYSLHLIIALPTRVCNFGCRKQTWGAQRVQISEKTDKYCCIWIQCIIFAIFTCDHSYVMQ